MPAISAARKQGSSRIAKLVGRVEADRGPIPAVRSAALLGSVAVLLAGWTLLGGALVLLGVAALVGGGVLPNHRELPRRLVAWLTTRGDLPLAPDGDDRD